DFHLQTTSLAVDAGDPVAYYLAEPSPNGGRLNLGSFGNTTGATPSARQLVQLLSPNGLEKVEVGQQVTIGWRASGLGSADTVALINVGGPTIDNWLFSNYGSGTFFTGTFTNTVDLSAVTNPAPMAVYQSYAQAPG